MRVFSSHGAPHIHRGFNVSIISHGIDHGLFQGFPYCTSVGMNFTMGDLTEVFHDDEGVFCPEEKTFSYSGAYRLPLIHSACLSVSLFLCCVLLVCNIRGLLITLAVRGRFPRTRGLWKRASSR